jgi:NADPH:quinone reductase-like Zn-dependent oxidoreductase
MKAAVIYQPGEMPQYTDFPEPVARGSNEVLITMKAAAIKHLDRSRAAGRHYSSKNDITQAKVIGGDGVGVLANGTRVFALGVSGMLAEKAVIEKDRMIKLPKGIDDVTAAALPNAVAGSAMGLLFRGGMKRGETILINGATGFTGKIAVQLARHYGAKKIIATGRNEQSLQSLKELGADEVVLTTDDDQFTAQLQRINQDTPIDIIIDYLWGHTAELILAALKGTGSFTHKVRFVSIGAVTGDKIQLSAEVLRSVDLHLTGSGLGSWTKEEMKKLFREIVPEMFQLAAKHKLKVETVRVDLKDIEKLWDMEAEGGKRLVITI